MARPRQPIDLIVHNGKKHLTKSEIEERRSREVKAASDKVRAPHYLPKELKKEFNKIAKDLIQIGIISNLDVNALATFVFESNMYWKKSLQLYEMDGDDPRYSDVHQDQDKHFKKAERAAKSMALTIDSRCKLVVPKKEEEAPKNKFSKFAK